KEMFCRAETLDPAVVDPASFKDLQGGSGSCGVINGETSSNSAFIFLFGLPLFLAVYRLRANLIMIIIVAVFTVSSGDLLAEEKVSGLNSQHFRPTVDG